MLIVQETLLDTIVNYRQNRFITVMVFRFPNIERHPS